MTHQPITIAAMEPRRVVKVALPAKLVAAMDEAVEADPGYDRSTFVADAVEAFLVELRHVGPEPSAMRAESEPAPAADQRLHSYLSTAPSEDMTPGLAALTSLPAPEEWGDDRAAGMPTPEITVVGPAADTPTVPFVVSKETEPTWGMHNRDWPTLWAASQLGDLSRRGPVDFGDWVDRLAHDAYAMTQQYHDPDLDFSGLPTDRNRKLERSLGRFRGFFVGAAPGDGPMFSLGLAGPARESGTVLLTAPGADLLRTLEGLEPRKTRMRDDWRAAYLAHLAAWVPLDFAFLRSVIELLFEGRTRRMDLLESMAEQHPEWSETFVATNVAGFVARGREWNLVEPSQEKGQYKLVSDAIEALDAAAAAADGLQARYA